jgi:hypothetical protein
MIENTKVVGSERAVVAPFRPLSLCTRLSNGRPLFVMGMCASLLGFYSPGDGPSLSKLARQCFFIVVGL